MALKVEIWSDVVCPWCYIGKRRFEAAAAQFDGEVAVTWRSFELDPGAPAMREHTASEHLAAKYGMSAEQAEASHAQMTELAAQEGLEYHFERARGGLSQQVLELGEDLLDRVQVGRVLRQEEQFGTGGANELPHRLAFVAAEIVHDDDVAFAQRRHKDPLDIGSESLAVDRSLKKPGCFDSIEAQCGHEGHRGPASLWDLCDQALAERRPSTQRRHIGLGPRLVDEDETLRLDAALIFCPLRAPPRHVGTVAFASHQAFF